MTAEHWGDVLAARAVSHAYGDRTVLDGVSLRVAAGEIHALIGPNGAGKSTLLRAVLGLLSPAAGLIEILGVARTDALEVIPGVAGFVETPRFWPGLTGLETLQALTALDRSPAGSGLPSARTPAECLALVGLAGAADRPVKGYSLGMRQRLALASSLLSSPAVLLLDEPTSGLDPVGVLEMHQLLRRLADEGVAIVLSSHDLVAVCELAGSVTILSGGRAVYQGPLGGLAAIAPDPSYLLETTAPDLTLRLAGGIDTLAVDMAHPGTLRLRGHITAIDALVPQVIEAGVSLRSLRLERQPLEELFARLTTEDLPALERPAGQPPVRSRGRSGLTRHGAALVLRHELRRAAHQRGLRAAALVCAIAPFLFIALLDLQDNLPKDTLFGRQLHESGYATPLVILGFAGSWLFPVIGGLAAGDVFSIEDFHGTWPLLLTRARSRAELFAGKLIAAAACSAAAVLLLGVASLAAGLLFVGAQPLTGTTGNSLHGWAAIALVAEAWLSSLVPVLAFTAVGAALSLRTRQSWVGVGGPVLLGLVTLLVAQLAAPPLISRLLLSGAFDAWHGFASDPGSAAAFGIGCVTSLAWISVALAAGWRGLMSGEFGHG